MRWTRCGSWGSPQKTQIHQESTSELYGVVQEIPQKESCGMVASNGVLFNHESPRRGETFVTRKITRGLARVDAGLDDCCTMGNLDALRDWGHPVTRALLVAPPRVSDLLCGLYGTGKQSVDGLGLPLPQGVATGTGHRASDRLWCPVPRATSRAAAWGLPISLPDATPSLVRFRRTSSGELKLSAR